MSGLICFLSSFIQVVGCLLRLSHLSFDADIRGEKTRKEYAVQLKRHRAAVCIQKRVKGRIGRKRFKNVSDASVQIQSGTFLIVYAKSITSMHNFLDRYVVVCIQTWENLNGII